MQLLQKLYSWYGKETVLIVGLVIVALIAMVLFSFNTEQVAEVETGTDKPVQIERVSALLGGASFSTIGTVEAVNESRIESEASGRVTRVYVNLGDEVRAGAVIAELENAAERAVVLQAEGAYEAARASAAQSDVSTASAVNALKSAKNAGVNEYRNAFTSSDDAIRNLVDDFFGDVDDSIFGIKLDAKGNAPALVNERRAIEVILDEWSAAVNTTPDVEDPDAAITLLNDALTDTKRITQFVDQIALLVSDEKPGTVYSETALASYDARFLAARSSLNNVINSINNNTLAIENAKTALERAELGGTNPDISAANAAVKQALGSLRGAQANLAKTIIRTPISGTVNEIPVRAGDFIGVREHIATVANNGSLLITTYVSETDRGRIAVNDTVTVADRATGTITHISPAVDAATKKIEVKIETNSGNLSNGDTVRVSMAPREVEANTATDVVIPIAALKVETDRTITFTVSEDNTLVAHEVETGPLVGENIVIESGVTTDMVIVLDARGLSEGDKVVVVE